jgi:DNA (cytosine-5)-methyltransferase 1
MEFRPLVSCDISSTAQAVYADNFSMEPCPTLDLDGLSSLVESTLTPFEIRLAERIDSQLDIVLAGPPCQGHSNLNNYTRRSDPKNGLYFKVARFAKLFAPRCIVIENVATVTRDSGNVVPRTMNELTRLGYRVEVGTLDLSKLGVPQARKRHVLIAACGEYARRVPSIRHIASTYSKPLRTVAWALQDLLEVDTTDLFDTASTATAETQRRIDHLFDNELFDLPDRLRPDCHRTKDHTYRAVYGRMNWNAPAPTITGGFCTMGQGRFVHPLRRRTLTPHEAARLQMIPDHFSFAAAQTRKAISELIGNAVPPKLSYIVALELFR